MVLTERAVEAIRSDGKREWTALSDAGKLSRVALSSGGGWIAATLESGGIVLAQPGSPKPLTGSPKPLMTLSVESGKVTTGPGAVVGGLDLRTGRAFGSVHLDRLPNPLRFRAASGLAN